MDSKRLIAAGLALLIGAAAGFFAGKGVGGDNSFPLPPDRQQTYVTFQLDDRWYMGQATNKDPVRPCEPPLSFLAGCDPMPDPDPCKRNPENCFTGFDPRSFNPPWEDVRPD